MARYRKHERGFSRTGVRSQKSEFRSQEFRRILGILNARGLYSYRKASIGSRDAAL